MIQYYISPIIKQLFIYDNATELIYLNKDTLDINSFVKLGDTVKVKITKVKDGKISLSMKALEEAPAPSDDDIPELSQVVSHEKATTNLGDLLKNIKWN